MNTADIKLFSLLQKKNFTETEAEDFVGLLNTREEASKTDLSKIFLTKEDKIDILNKISTLEMSVTNRMDSHFKWLAGIVIATIGLAFTLLKFSL